MNNYEVDVEQLELLSMKELNKKRVPAKYPGASHSYKQMEQLLK